MAKILGEILRFTTLEYKCSVPHDMIYGILGLVPTGGNFPKQLVPDYNLPLANVYREYFRFIVERIGDLSLLSTYRSDLQGVPSWVPDFRHRNVSNELAAEFAQNKSGFARITFSLDGQRTMNVKGIEYGRILATKALLPEDVTMSVISLHT